MNFFQVRENLAHMLSDNSYIVSNANPKKIDMTNINGIRLYWDNEKVYMNINSEPSFSITYGDRTEGELAAEVVKILQHLSDDE